MQNLQSVKLHYNSYALLRSILALSTLLTFVFNSDNILFPAYIDISRNKAVYTQLQIGNINVSYFIFTHINIFRWIFIIGLMAVISGFYPRITGVIHLLIAFIFARTSMIIDGGDQICSNLALLLLPITLIDGSKNHWNRKSDFNNIFSNTIFQGFSFLICVQIAVVYLHSAVAKLSAPEWLDGTAIWYWFGHEIFGANYLFGEILLKLMENGYLIYLITYSIIAVEILIAMMLFVPKKGLLPKYVFIVGIIFHVMIIFIHGIFSFAIVMIGCLCFYFQKEMPYKRNHPQTSPKNSLNNV